MARFIDQLHRYPPPQIDFRLDVPPRGYEALSPDAYEKLETITYGLVKEVLHNNHTRGEIRAILENGGYVYDITIDFYIRKLVATFNT